VVRLPELRAVVGPDVGGYLFGSCQIGPGRGQFQPLPTTARSEHLPEDVGEALDAQRRIGRWLPGLSRLPILEYRQGFVTFSADGYPVAGRDPRIASLWVATGCGALGDLFRSAVRPSSGSAATLASPTPKRAAAGAASIDPLAPAAMRAVTATPDTT
jgi:hypothetical protein